MRPRQWSLAVALGLLLLCLPAGASAGGPADPRFSMIPSGSGLDDTVLRAVDDLTGAAVDVALREIEESRAGLPGEGGLAGAIMDDAAQIVDDGARKCRTEHC